MKVRFLVLLFAILVNAEITNQAEFLRAINTPSPFNHCIGARLENGHNAEFMACVRTYYPSCVNKFSNVDTFKCMFNSQPVNVTQKDIQRQKQIEEWLQQRQKKQR